MRGRWAVSQKLIRFALHLHRSPDLSSSRDDDDSGYNSIKVDEVINRLYFFNPLCWQILPGSDTGLTLVEVWSGTAVLM